MQGELNLNPDSSLQEAQAIMLKEIKTSSPGIAIQGNARPNDNEHIADDQQHHILINGFG